MSVTTAGTDLEGERSQSLVPTSRMDLDLSKAFFFFLNLHEQKEEKITSQKRKLFRDCGITA